MKSLSSGPGAFRIIGVQGGNCKKPNLILWPKVFVQSGGTGNRFIKAGSTVLYNLKEVCAINYSLQLLHVHLAA